MAEVGQALQAGDLKRADQILRTIAQTPDQANNPKACIYWGILASQQGDDAQAIHWLARALVLDPKNVQALVNLGELKRHQGDPHTAVTLLERAIAERPEHIDALANLGIALIDCGDADAAQAPLRQALRLQPNHLNAASSLARALQELGELEQACEVLDAAERLHPGNPQLIGNRGLLMAALAQPAAALRLYECALALKHDQPALLFARGNAEVALGLLEQANTSFQRAVELQPHYPEALCNRGTVLVQLGQMQEAQACLEQAIAQQPAYPAASLNLTNPLMHKQAIDKAWEAYEQRWHTGSPPILSAEPAIPRWPGNQPWPGAELLLVGEQGLGDSLQFLRCAPLLAKKGARVSLCVPAKLHKLVAQSGLGVDVITREQAMQRRSGYWLPLLSAAGQLQLHGQQPSGSVPYLHAAPERARHWRQRFVADSPNERLLVMGVHWQGNPDTEVNNLRGRSFRLQILAPLAQLPNVRLVSLQKGAGSEQLEQCSFRDRFVACQAEVNDCWDFAECAAITAACDLVISNDSACVHLAGALGIRTWLLLHHVPDWRWGLSGDRTAWYPSMRLFRQPRRGDWGSVIQAVRAALSGSSVIGTPPRHAEDWQQMHQAEQALSTGQLEDAIRCCEALLAEGVRTPTLLSYRALAAGLSGDLEASRLWLEEALSLDPNHVPSLVNLGETERRLGRLEQAVHWLELALALDAEHSDGLENLGVALEEQKQSSEAENYLLKAATLCPHNSVYQYNLAAAYKKRGDLESAVRRYRQAIALDPEHGDSRFNLGLILLLQGNYQEGWQHYEWRVTTRTLLPSHLVAGLPRWAPIHQHANERLVIVAEQGLGDTLQFLRYL
ncbi:MAG: tetratricopeptide repeat protein, partial [Synechococcaceae cyanobacterium]|nr:tetratricopeptide repeat protein [Synechococcaceae cyanobacterium]